MLTLLTVSWPTTVQQKTYKVLHSLCRALLHGFSACPGAFQRSSWCGFPVHMLLVNQAHSSTPMFCHGTALGWVEMHSELFLDAEAAQIHQYINSARRSAPHQAALSTRIQSCHRWLYFSIQSLDRASPLCSCVSSDLCQLPGRWPSCTFWVSIRSISFLLHRKRVHHGGTML